MDESAQGGGLAGFLVDLLGQGIKGVADVKAAEANARAAEALAREKAQLAAMSGASAERTQAAQLAVKSDQVKYLALAAVGIGIVIIFATRLR